MKNRIVLVITLVIMAMLLSACPGDSEIDKNINEGNQKLEDKEYQKAAELFEDALELDERNIDAKYGLAAAYINMGKFEEADMMLWSIGEGDIEKLRSDIVVHTILKFSEAKRSVAFESYDDEEEMWEALGDLYQLLASEDELKEERETAMDSESDQNNDIVEEQTESNSGDETEGESEVDEVVVFKDPVFEQAIRKLLELPEGPIMSSSISETTHVAIYQVSGEIKTIEDLKLFENIELLELNCTQNDLTIRGDLSTIGELSKLTFLRLCETDLTGDLSDINQLYNLKKIEFDRNGINGNLSDISNLTKLKGIDMVEENVTGDLSSLSQLRELRGLYFEKTGITGNLSSLSQCAELNWINLSETGVFGDLSGISGLTKMQFLSLEKTAVSGNLSSLTGMSSLKSLYLSFTSVGGDLSVLSGLKDLNGLSTIKSNITGKITLSDGTVYDTEDF